MKHLLLTTIAAVVLVGCGESQSPKPPTVKTPDISIVGAADTGNIEAVQQHLAAGTDVNVKNKFGSSSLHYAASKGHKEIVKLLIAAGANVNGKIRGVRGITHLYFAAANGHKETVELLIAAGADVNPKNNFYPLDGAISHKHTEIAALLRKHGGKTKHSNSIHFAAKEGNIEAVKQHLAAGADVNAKRDDGWTLLHIASGSGRYEIVELLIAAGADVNAKGGKGWTPLHHAAFKGHKEVAELLIANGADLNAKNDDGSTPLDWAIFTNKTKITDLLRNHGGKTAKELKAEGK